MTTDIVPPKITRTSQGLRDSLFDEMDLLRSGRSNPQRASAMAKLAVQIIGTVSMDIEYQKHVATTGIMSDATPLPAITLGSQPQAQAA